jgi:hypothetical protein
MKKVLPVLLLLAVSFPARAGTLSAGGMLNSGNYWPGLNVGIGWVAKDLNPATKIKVTLLRNGAPLRVLGSGLPLTNGDPPQDGPFRLGHIYWMPAAADIGCHYSVLVAAEDGSASFTSQPFGIFAAMNFPTKGAPSNVRLDQPTEGRVLVLGERGMIAWSLIADPKLWPSKKVKLELFFQNSKVGDIAEVSLDFAGCPAHGSYTWPVGKVTGITDYSRIPDGKNLIPGNYYWVRASGDGSSYFGPQFVIAGKANLPAPGSTPLHKVPAGNVPGKPMD